MERVQRNTAPPVSIEQLTHTPPTRVYGVPQVAARPRRRSALEGVIGALQGVAGVADGVATIAQREGAQRRRDQDIDREIERRVEAVDQAEALTDARTSFPGVIDLISQREIGLEDDEDVTSAAERIVDEMAAGMSPAARNAVYREFAPRVAQALTDQQAKAREEAQNETIRSFQQAVIGSSDTKTITESIREAGKIKPGVDEMSVARSTIPAALEHAVATEDVAAFEAAADAAKQYGLDNEVERARVDMRDAISGRIFDTAASTIEQGQGSIEYIEELALDEGPKRRLRRIHETHLQRQIDAERDREFLRLRANIARGDMSMEDFAREMNLRRRITDPRSPIALSEGQINTLQSIFEVEEAKEKAAIHRAGDRQIWLNTAADESAIIHSMESQGLIDASTGAVVDPAGAARQMAEFGVVPGRYLAGIEARAESNDHQMIAQAALEYASLKDAARPALTRAKAPKLGDVAQARLEYIRTELMRQGINPFMDPDEYKRKAEGLAIAASKITSDTVARPEDAGLRMAATGASSPDQISEKADEILQEHLPQHLKEASWWQLFSNANDFNNSTFKREWRDRLARKFSVISATGRDDEKSRAAAAEAAWDDVSRDYVLVPHAGSVHPLPRGGNRQLEWHPNSDEELADHINLISEGKDPDGYEWVNGRPDMSEYTPAIVAGIRGIIWQDEVGNILQIKNRDGDVFPFSFEPSGVMPSDRISYNERINNALKKVGIESQMRRAKAVMAMGRDGHDVPNQDFAWALKILSYENPGSYVLSDETKRKIGIMEADIDNTGNQTQTEIEFDSLIDEIKRANPE